MRLLALLPLLALAACGQSPVPTHDASVVSEARTPMRVATYNVSLHGEAEGELLARLEAGDDQARRIAAVIQRQRPEILLLNEFDYEPSHRAAELFRRDYLGQGQFGEDSIDYPYLFLAPSNTGIPSGLDLTGDGRTDGPGDAWGFGQYPGQYGMLVLSMHPIDMDAVRTFQQFRWKDLPDAKEVQDPETGAPWYPPSTWEQLRLSSKSHWDVPIDTPLGRIHLLAAHPTPPAFDGPERRNARRNHDEIRFWAEYIAPGAHDWIVDDAGRRGGLPDGALFVIAGDLNADPADGNSLPAAIHQLLEHPRVLRYATPASEGAVVSAATRGGANPQHRGNPAHDTGEFSLRVGNLRADYVLPSVGLQVVDSGVFWPLPDTPEHALTQASDHHMVWVDIIR